MYSSSPTKTTMTATKILVSILVVLAVTIGVTNAAGTDTPVVVSTTATPQGQYVCMDTMYCAPAKVSGKPCVMHEECLSEICQGNVCVPNEEGLKAGSRCSVGTDCAPGLSCENLVCN